MQTPRKLPLYKIPGTFPTPPTCNPTQVLLQTPRHTLSTRSRCDSLATSLIILLRASYSGGIIFWYPIRTLSQAFAQSLAIHSRLPLRKPPRAIQFSRNTLTTLSCLHSRDFSHKISSHPLKGTPSSETSNFQSISIKSQPIPEQISIKNSRTQVNTRTMPR